MSDPRSSTRPLQTRSATAADSYLSSFVSTDRVKNPRVHNPLYPDLRSSNPHCSTEDRPSPPGPHPASGPQVVSFDGVRGGECRRSRTRVVGVPVCVGGTGLLDRGECRCQTPRK